MKKVSWFAALAALMCLGVAPVVGGCGDDDDDDTADGDADSDSDADSDGDGDGDCLDADPLANGGCAWTCNDAAAPDFRLTALSLTAPTALTNAIIKGLITQGIDEGTFVWLVDNQGGTNFRTGAGTCSDAGLSQCDFEGGDFPPASGAMDFDQGTGAFRLPSGTDTLDVDVVIHSDTVGDIILNAKEAFISGTVSHGGNCVGSRTNDATPSTWETGGQVTGKITAADANEVRIPSPLSMSLCDLLSGGAADGYCDDHADPGTWPNSPDTTVGTDPAWTLQGDLAAIGVQIP